jgi:cytochrome c oxidase subunit 2
MIPIWALISLIGELLLIIVGGPHLPPGALTTTAASQQIDLTVIAATALPVVVAVLLYMVYAMIVWRAPAGENGTVDGPPIRGHLPFQIGFIAGTTVIVLSMFVYGTIELIVPAGAGGGEGPAPIWTPSTHNVLDVQVIAQQWKFTYRYPSYGGFETDQLMLPTDTTISFHVTSLDVIHSFWAYGLGVKADANPEMDNVAFTTTKGPGAFEVRCAELCGLWHGAMYNNGSVVPKAAFQSWASSTESHLASLTKLLPAFAWTYTPDANGADGAYYQDNIDPYSNAELYQAPAKAK